MIKRIGILTFHASHNYGSMLQAYALQTYLERKGFDVTIINQRNLAQKHMYIKPGQLLRRKSIKEYVANPRLFVQNIGKWHRFEKFMTNYYHLSREFVDLVSTERAINGELELDAVITGGDQIWNMNCLDFSLSYYLPFETPGIRRISYAPSLGDEQWWRPLHYVDVIKALVGKYDYPSVREKSSSVFLTELLGHPVPFVPDPVFLLDKQDYDVLAGEKPLIKGDYIFYYSPQPNSLLAGFVARLAKQRGYKVISSNKGTGKEEKDFIPFCNAGPVEFLNLLKYATLVCGRSMHLVAFSLILHKPFYALSRSSGARVSHLLDEVGLRSRLVRVDTAFPSIDKDSIDWMRVEMRLDILRERGCHFLEEVLS